MKAAKLICAVALSLCALVGSAQAAESSAPGWKVVAASGPTNLPPVQSEVQQVTVAGEGGTFKLGFEGQETAALSYDASAAEVQSALEALVAIGSGNVSVSGGPGGDAESPFFVAFDGTKADADVKQLSSDGSLLVGQPSFATVSTIVPGGLGTGEIGIFTVNVGGSSSSGRFTVHLGPLPEGVETAGEAKGASGGGWTCTTEERELECENQNPVAASSQGKVIGVPVKVTSSTPLSATVPVSIEGGGAAGPDSFQMPLVVSPQRAEPGAGAFWAGAFNKDGTPAHQAGSHPANAFTYFVLNTIRTQAGQIVPAGLAKDISVDIPTGFLGNPMVTARCPQSQLFCGDQQARVGSLYSSTNFALFVPGAGGVDREDPFYNNVPLGGYAAQFTTKIVAPTQTLLGSVRSESDFGVSILAPHAASTFQKLFKSFAVLEGFPLGAGGKPFLTMQSDCAEEARSQPAVKATFNTWQEPDHFFNVESLQPPVTGCDQLEFTAYDKQTKEGQVSFSFQPNVQAGSSPTGATAHLHIDQSGLTDPDSLATPSLKRSVVKLPAGLSLNPSQANGLEACSEAEVGYKGPGDLPNPTRFSNAPVSCPQGSKLGTVEATSPLLEEPLKGTIYLANQEENPFDSLIAIYLVIESPRFGITIKLPGRVDPDPVSGQLTATFDYNPQQPVEDLTLRFRGGGPRSALATPEVCGTYTTHGSWEPWSAPESGPPAETADSFEIQESCAETAADRYFEPSFEAGTASTQAGAYAPLVVKVARQDGEQDLGALNFTLPPGVTGSLAGIATCTDAEIAAAGAKTGRQEQASSSCPGASRLGSVDTAAGVGSEPFHAHGTVYLAGPYKGAPVSSVVIAPAVAGPFDLGNVVVRAPIYIDPETAQLSVRSDPIPTILKGIPLKVRSVSISVDRPGFILNPSDCTAMRVQGTMVSAEGATYNKRNRFQVGGCEKLAFSPKLKLNLKGGTKRNGHPSLTAVLTQPPGQARIASLSVALPHSEFLENANIRTICTRVQFNEGAGGGTACPAGSIYGHVRAWSPLVDYALEGPAILRSSDHELPDLVAVVRGPDFQPIVVAQAGRIDSVRGGIRTSFETFPDVPISKVVLKMQGGRNKGLLVNSTNICRGNHRATVKIAAQNGDAFEYRPQLKASCGGKKKAKKGHGSHRRARALDRFRAGW